MGYQKAAFLVPAKVSSSVIHLFLRTILYFHYADTRHLAKFKGSITPQPSTIIHNKKEEGFSLLLKDIARILI